MRANGMLKTKIAFVNIIKKMQQSNLLDNQKRETQSIVDDELNAGS